MIENFGGIEEKTEIDGRTIDANIEIFERLDADGHIKGKVLRYLDIYGYHKENVNDKEIYVIYDSKVNNIERGHVVLEHPVITFTEGQIPRNTYHNTLAFRFSIGLSKIENYFYKQDRIDNPKKYEKLRQEEEKKKEKQRLKEKKEYDSLSPEDQKAVDQMKQKAEKEAKKYLDADDFCEENPEDFKIMFVLKKDPNSQDKIKSVQYTRQTGAIEVYYFDPLSAEDEEDDGIFIGRITD